MPDYQKMYYTLFNALSDVIRELQKAQERVEEIYIETASDVETEKEGTMANFSLFEV